MSKKKQELEKLHDYLMGLPVVQTQIKLRSELTKKILAVCDECRLRDKHIKDILVIAEHWALGNCTLPYKSRCSDGPHITDFIFSQHPATKNKRKAWETLKPWLDDFHSRYYGDPPQLQKIHVQIKATSFVVFAEYDMLCGWLKCLHELKAEHFSDGIDAYQVRERRMSRDSSANAKLLE